MKAQSNNDKGQLTSARNKLALEGQGGASCQMILAGHETIAQHNNLPSIISDRPPHVNNNKSHASNLIDSCLDAEDKLSYDESPDPAKLAAIRALRHQAERMAFEGGAVLDLPDLPPPPPKPLTEAQAIAIGCFLQRVGRQAYRQLKQQCNVPIETPITRLSRQQAWLLINHITREDRE